MKLQYILFTFCLLIFSTCDDDVPEIENVFISSATLNSESEWKANDCHFNNERANGYVVIELSFLNSQGFLREEILFKGFELKVGMIPLEYTWRGHAPEDRPTAFFDTFTSDGDAVTEYYELHPDADLDNYLQITSISSDGLEIEGNYQLTFSIADTSPPKFDESRLDTLIFTEGIFKAIQL